MLDTIREYGLDEMRSAGELEPARRAHATYYLALAEEAAGKLGGPETRARLERVESRAWQPARRAAQRA